MSTIAIWNMNKLIVALVIGVWVADVGLLVLGKALSTRTSTNVA